MDIMCDINFKYKQHVRFKGGRKTFFLRIIKEISWMIKSSILWYKLYVSVLKEMGFQINPYDMCVANKYINGIQCIVAWYVGDNKVSHVEQDVIYYVINKVEDMLIVLTVTKGNMHTFLGMKTRHLKNRTTAINIKE